MNKGLIGKNMNIYISLAIVDSLHNFNFEILQDYIIYIGGGCWSQQISGSGVSVSRWESQLPAHITTELQNTPQSIVTLILGDDCHGYLQRRSRHPPSHLMLGISIRLILQGVLNHITEQTHAVKRQLKGESIPIKTIPRLLISLLNLKIELCDWNTALCGLTMRGP